MNRKTVPLSKLGLATKGGGNWDISGLSVDSRSVQKGHLFAALPGTRVHGAQYVEKAISLGAVAVLTDTEGAAIIDGICGSAKPPIILTDTPRETLSRTAALWFDAQPQTMVAVTGTNGKTSVAHFVRQIWQHMGFRAINLGTTGVEGAWTAPLNHTTPEPITLHRILAQAAEAGVTHAAMEASSHGLDQRRLDGVALTAAGFTNFTQDHLDYHQTFEAYFDAKAGLFARVLSDEGVAVVNIDDPKGVDIAAIANARGCATLTVGRDGGDLQLRAQRLDSDGQELRFSWSGQTFQTRVELIGAFQADNALLAAALVIACGGAPEAVFAALPQLRTVRGRMQRVATRASGATIFVDYAHTPDAVATALSALRPHVMGKLWIVLGAGGDRDPGKRPLMGAAAAQNADAVIVTDDNPRSEDPALIRKAVLDGAPNAIEIGDRAEAILRGVDKLASGDALLIAGKGHETGQTIGADVFPFDDAEQASIAAAALDGKLT
ncbi:MAG: UDP-N-acetylmuramoyl-L-alanyl-D-glutamate--2,6-diaminopimelate ligase [Pseudomonadota bacterium]